MTEAIPWQTAGEAFERILREQGERPDVEAAWAAFAGFLRLEISGLAPEDGDGFLVQWGRRSWRDDRLHLALTRQLAVAEPPELWQVELTVAFDDTPALLAADSGPGDTEFRFEPPGPARSAALAEVRAQAWEHALVRAMWSATPAAVAVAMDPAD